MNKAEKIFNIVVTIVVTLTGAGFGAFTGLAYAEPYWWVGLAAGAVAGLPLAKFYLRQLAGSSAKGKSKTATWLWGTFIAILCGIICTTIVHGLMGLTLYPDFSFSGGELPVSWAFVIFVGEIIGAVAGLVVGAICSLIYVSTIMDETA